ncbi:hypothetical protein GCM10025771_06500 [Niveibacterium umoris]|uniref:Uncharacterized protein n=1 Tax=Niveibacterium umoris TaxID=1193620 RepID=A0A840BMD7_9RHOO|nr:hypothetical protein [Niveibacterium umoris]MBB4013803.1 hypothetical protein [Niveibacterium umoris]
MDPITIAYLTSTSTGAGLSVAAVTGVIACFKGKQKGAVEYEQHCEANIRDYTRLLGAKIREANDTPAADFEFVIRRAAKVVKMRDEFKEDLDSLRALLNATIDELASALDAKSEASLTNREVEIRRLVGILNESWHGKETLLESKLRDLLAKLGVFRRHA